MATPHWLKQLRSTVTRRLTKGRGKTSLWARPRLEALEDRRLPSAGSLDITFGHGGTVSTSLGSDDDEGGQIFALPNGKVLVAGSTDLGTNFSNEVLALLRYNADGTLDSSYQNGAKPGAPSIFSPSNDIAMGPEGQVAILQGSTLWQFNPDGSPDTAFGSGSITTDFTPGHGFYQRLAPDSAIAFDGDKIIDLGLINDPSTGFPELILQRYNIDGSLDNTFGTNGTAIQDFGIAAATGFSNTGVTDANSLIVQPNGAILVGGALDAGTFYPLTPGGALNLNPVPFLARFNPNGSLDTSFGPDQSGKEIFIPGDKWQPDFVP